MSTPWFFAGLYQTGDWLLFGAETTGLPQEVGPLLVDLRECHTGTVPWQWALLTNCDTRIENCSMAAQAYDSVEQSGGLVVRVPIVETHVRSLNIAVSQGIGLYEAMRQIDGPP